MVRLNHFHRGYLAIFLSITSAFAGVIPFSNPINFTSENSFLYIHTQAFYANDAFSINTRLNKLHGTQDIQNGKNNEIIDIRLDSGYFFKDFGYVGYVYREESFVSMSQGMAKLYYNVRNKIDLERGENYQLALEADASKMQGILYANSFKLTLAEDFKIYIGGAVELLIASKMQRWSMYGDAQAIGKKDYDYNVVSDNYYTKNYLYKLQVPKSEATGYSSHLALKIEYKKLIITFLIDDLIGKLYWENLPYSYVKAKTDNRTYDENGYVKFQPSISGIEKLLDYTQTLEHKLELDINYSFDVSQVLLGCDYIYDNYLPYLEYRYNWSSNFSTKVGYETRFNSYYTEVQYKKHFLGVRIDSLEEQKNVSLNIGISF